MPPRPCRKNCSRDWRKIHCQSGLHEVLKLPPAEGWLSWLKAPDSKSGDRLIAGPGVRIPPLPPVFSLPRACRCNEVSLPEHDAFGVWRADRIHLPWLHRAGSRRDHRRVSRAGGETGIGVGLDALWLGVPGDRIGDCDRLLVVSPVRQLNRRRGPARTCRSFTGELHRRRVGSDLDVIAVRVVKEDLRHAGVGDEVAAVGDALFLQRLFRGFDVVDMKCDVIGAR